MAHQAHQQFSAKRIAAAVSIALYRPPPETPKPRQQHPKPEAKPEPRPPSLAIYAAMNLADLFRHCSAHPPADPLTSRLVEAAEAEFSGLEDDLCAEQGRREAAERELAESRGRIEWLEGVLESEGVPASLWR